MKKVVLVVFLIIFQIWAVMGVSAILSDGLVNYYPFDNQNISNFAGDYNHGSWDTGNPAIYVPDCVLGGCYNFSSVDNRINVGDINLTDGFSMFAWVNSRHVNPLDSQGILSSGTGNNAEREYEFHIKNSNARMALWTNITELRTVSGSVNSNKWYPVVATYNYSSKELKIYVNGTLRDTDTYVGDGITHKVSNDARIGIHYYEFKPFNGTIDELAIWNRTLSQAEITNISTGFNLSEFFDVDNYTISGCVEIKKSGTYNLTKSLYWNTTGSCINIQADDVVIDCKGFNISHSQSFTNSEYGVNIDGSNIVIKDCKFIDTYMGVAQSDQTTRRYNVTVDNNIFIESYNRDIWLNVTGLIVTNNSFLGSGTIQDAGSLVNYHNDDIEIIDNIWNNTPFRAFFIWDSDNVTIAYNIFDNISMSYSGYGVEVWASNSVVHDNRYLSDNDDRSMIIRYVKNMSVYSNTILDGQRCLTLQTTKGTDVFDNVIDGCSVTGVTFVNNVEPLAFHNNIVSHASNGLYYMGSEYGVSNLNILVYNNTFSHNIDGVEFLTVDTTSNKIINNNFINNSRNAVSTTARNFTGNYYGDGQTAGDGYCILRPHNETNVQDYLPYCCVNGWIIPCGVDFSPPSCTGVASASVEFNSTYILNISCSDDQNLTYYSMICTGFYNNTLQTTNINKSYNFTYAVENMTASFVCDYLVKDQYYNASYHQSISVFTPLEETLTTGVCPTTDAGSMILVGMMFFALGFIAVGIFARIGVLTFFGAILLMILSWTLAGCNTMVASTIALFSIVIIIMSVTMIPVFRKR